MSDYIDLSRVDNDIKLKVVPNEDGTSSLSVSGSVSLPAGTSTIGGTLDAGPGWTSTHTITNSADMTSATNVSGTPTSGQKLVLTDLIISVGSAMNVTIKEETSGTVLAGPYYLPANSTLQITPRSKFFKLATINKRIQAVASVAGNITVETWTYSEA